MLKNNKIKFQSYLSIVSFSFFYLGYFCHPARSQVAIEDNCKVAIESIAKEIHQYGTSVIVTANDIANIPYANKPTMRNISLRFGLGDMFKFTAKDRNFLLLMKTDSSQSEAIAKNILYSNQLLQKWSDRLVKECQDVADIYFTHSEYMGCPLSFAIQSDGTTKLRKFLDDDLKPDSEPNPKLDWNYTGCT